MVKRHLWVFCLLFILSSIIVNAEYRINYGSPQWSLKRASGAEANYTFVSMNGLSANKTQLGWITPINNGTKYVYYCNGSQFRDVNNNWLQSAWGVNRVKLNNLTGKKALTADGYSIDMTGTNFNGINTSCLKLGNTSSVVAYVTTQSITIDEYGANITCGVYKSVAGNWSPIEALWYSGNEWGLNDTYAVGNSTYQIECNSTYEYLVNDMKYIYGSGIHDFTTMCEQEKDCMFYNPSSTSMRVTFESDGFIDPTYTILPIGSGNLMYNTTYEASNCTHLTIDPTQSITSSLVAYWNYDCDTATSYDMTANNYDMTLTTGAVSSRNNPKYGSSSLLCDGTNDYAEGMTTTSNPLYNYTDGSISVWFYNNKSASQQALFSYGQVGAGNNIRFTLEINSSGYIGIWGRNSSTTDLLNVRYATFTLNAWHHAVYTTNSSGNYFYLDNVLQNGTYTTGSNTTNMFTGHVKAAIPRADICADYENAYARFFGGYIDELMIFNTTLTPTQISEIYNNQSVRFYPRGEIYYLQQNISTNNTVLQQDYPDIQMYEGTNLKSKIGYWDVSKGYNNTDPNLIAYYHADNVTGNANVISGKVGNALQFDGVNDYVKITESQLPVGTTNITVVAWVKTSGVSSNTLFSYGTASNANRFLYGLSSGKAYFDYYGDGIAQGGISNTLINNSNWHLVAFNYQSSGLGTFYTDGVVDGSHMYNLAGTRNIILGGIARIGSHVTGTGPFNGSIDQMRIWNRSLSATEIANIYSNESTGVVDPNMNRTGLVGEWLLNESATSLWASMTPDTSGNTNHGIMTNMIGANISDSSGNGNNGVANGGTNLLNWGKYNQSFTFDGSSGYTNNGDNVKPDQITVSAWAYPTAAGTYSIVERGLGYGLRTTSGKWRAVAATTTKAWNYASPTPSVTLNTWTHVAMTVDNTGTTLYINGVSAGIDTTYNGTLNYSASGLLSIGSSGGTTQYFKGAIDEVMIWNRSLNASEILELYAKGRANWTYTGEEQMIEKNVSTFNYSASPSIVSCWIDGVTDSCGGGNNGVLVGGANWSNANRGNIGNVSLGLNGSTQYVNISKSSNLNLTGARTTSMWLYVNSFSATYTIPYSEMTSQNNLGESAFYITSSTGVLSYYRRHTQGSNAIASQTNIGTIYPKNWYHIVGVYDGTSYKSYFNGILTATTNTTTTFGGGSQVSNTIGADFGNSKYLDGYVDDVAIWSRALIDTEVQQIYFGTKQGRTNLMNFTIPENTTNILPIAVMYADTTYKWYTPFLRGVANIGNILNGTYPPDLCKYGGTGNWIIDCLVCNSYNILPQVYNLMGANFTFSGNGQIQMSGATIKNFTVGNISNGCKLDVDSGGKIEVS